MQRSLSVAALALLLAVVATNAAIDADRPYYAQDSSYEATNEAYSRSSAKYYEEEGEHKILVQEPACITVTDGVCVNQPVDITPASNPIYYSRYSFACCDQARAGSRTHTPKSKEPIPALYDPFFGEDVVCETWSTLYQANPVVVPGGNLLGTFNGHCTFNNNASCGGPLCAGMKVSFDEGEVYAVTAYSRYPDSGPTGSCPPPRLGDARKAAEEMRKAAAEGRLPNLQQRAAANLQAAAEGSYAGSASGHHHRSPRYVNPPRAHHHHAGRFDPLINDTTITELYVGTAYIFVSRITSVTGHRPTDELQGGRLQFVANFIPNANMPLTNQTEIAELIAANPQVGIIKGGQANFVFDRVVTVPDKKDY